MVAALTVSSLPRGIRNKNPGNIRKSGDQWKGLDSPADDGAFFRFESSHYGLRALARILINYRARYGIETIRGVIERYAPDVENNTESYIASVSKHTGVPADKRLVLDAFLPELIPAIIRHENGFNPYTDSQIARAILAAKV